METATLVMLSPDVSFVSNARLKEIMVSPEKFLQGAPDPVVEVLSTGDQRKIIEDKIGRCFEHGARLAWVVDPKKQTDTAHRPDRVVTVSGLDSVLTGSDVLPRFKCKPREIFLGE